MKNLTGKKKKELISASILVFCMFFQTVAFAETTKNQVIEPDVKVKTVKSSVQEFGQGVKEAITVKEKPAESNLVDKYKDQLKSNNPDQYSPVSKTIKLKTEFNSFADEVKIDFAFRDLDVATALRLLAKEGGKNVVVDNSVKGYIDLDLKNVSLNEAMQLVLTAQELEARTMGNTIFIASRPAMAKKGLNRRYVKAFKLNHSNAVDVASLLEASIFNKGFDVNENAEQDSSSSKSLAEEAGVMPVSNQKQPGFLATTEGGQNSLNSLTQNSNIQNNPMNLNTQSSINNSDIDGTTTGQSLLSKSRGVRGKVESLMPGSGFNDANQLASSIKLQGITTAIQKVDVNNNNGEAIVIPDTRTNSILIAGLKEDIELAAEAIKYLDKALPQVSIEVSLLEIKTNDLKEFNISGGADGKRNFSYGSNNPFAAFSGIDQIDLEKNQSDFTKGISPEGGLFTKDNYFSFLFDTAFKSDPLRNSIAFKLNYLNQKNKIRNLANPTIMTLDGSESLIKITDQIVSRLTVTVSQDGTIYTSPQLAEVGIVLNILPKVSSDGSVTMRIRPSVTTAGEQITTDKYGGFATPISTREVILQDARIRAGQTLAIAGLMKDDELESIRKIPGLGDLKIFGNLFKNKSFSKAKSELIILITPRIVDEIQAN